MNKIITGKMVFQRIINNSEKKSNINTEQEDNYLNDLRKELGNGSRHDINKRKIFKIKTNNNNNQTNDNKETNNNDNNTKTINNNINNETNNNDNNKETNNNDTNKEINNNDTNKETNNNDNTKTINNDTKKTNIIEINNQSIRAIFFTKLKSKIQEKKFINLREKKINTELIQNFKGKIERHIDKKYNFKILDLINYYDINYKIFKVYTHERNNQDKFYNNIKYFNILEFYPNNGCLSCLLNNKLEYSDKHFVIQNNTEYIKIIEDNKNTHNSFFNIININPEEINVSEYLVNCIIFNNISNENYTKIINIINNNLENLKSNIFDIYFEKLNNYDISSVYKILESISFIKRLSEENREHREHREHWINNN